MFLPSMTYMLKEGGVNATCTLFSSLCKVGGGATVVAPCSISSAGSIKGGSNKLPSRN